MSRSIVQAVARIKRNVAEFLTAESIQQACRDAGHTWRERELGPATTVWAFLLQVLHGNIACAHAKGTDDVRTGLQLGTAGHGRNGPHDGGACRAAELR